jgi:cbb3-type cytochrome oxidase maturation protein
VSILALTIPASLLLAGTLLALVVRAALRGDFDDWEGPAARHFLDDDSDPECDPEADGSGR